MQVQVQALDLVQDQGPPVAQGALGQVSTQVSTCFLRCSSLVTKVMLDTTADSSSIGFHAGIKILSCLFTLCHLTLQAQFISGCIES